MTLQNTLSEPYLISELKRDFPLYNDRPYTWENIPKFMKNMTSIQVRGREERSKSSESVFLERIGVFLN